MSAFGLSERQSTLVKLQTINAGLAWQGSVEDDYEMPRDADGRVTPHSVIRFGAPIRSSRDRNLAFGEKGQPHVLAVNIACVAGDAGEAQGLAAAIFDLLLDWRPSDTSDPFEAKGSYGARRASTEFTPTRYIEGLYFETVVNQGIQTP